MMNIRVIAHFRSFSTSLIALAAAKEARVMNKLLKGSATKRSWFPSKEISATSVPQNFLPQKGERNHRRINVLNKLFMKYVSDIMSTGEISNEIAGLRLEISKVKISSDFGTLNVYWITKGTKIDKEIDGILQKNAGKLKHELTQLRVIGNVPAVQFVKDKSLSKLADVDVLLSKADFGDDFEPTDPSLSLISEFSLKSKLPPELQDKILADGVVDTDPIPPMATDVLGFDHGIVMQKVLRSVNKSHALHRRIPAASINDDMESDSDTSDVKNTEIQSSLPGNCANMTVNNSELKKFVLKRIALQNKLSKPSKNYHCEKELFSSETDVFEDEELNDTSLRSKELEIELDNFDDVIESNDSYFYNRKDF